LTQGLIVYERISHYTGMTGRLSSINHRTCSVICTQQAHHSLAN